MNTYLLPKIQFTIIISPTSNPDNITNPYISFSLFKYHIEILNEITTICINKNINLNDMLKIMNPYEYIFNKIPGINISVSKLNFKTYLFYDLFEIFVTLNIFNIYKYPIKILHLTNNYDSIECIKMLRDNYTDEIHIYDKINNTIINLIENTKFHFLYFESIETNLIKYINSLIEFIMIIFKNQEFNGTCILKINTILFKPIIDILYILSTLYNKVYILKPTTSNLTSSDKYIICKKFEPSEINTSLLMLNYSKLNIILSDNPNTNIISLLNYDISLYFKMKINDINIIMGNQQLEILNSLMNLLMNKNKKDKIELMSKTNIQKSILWCEKFKISYNILSDKNNIFLPQFKHDNLIEQFI